MSYLTELHIESAPSDWNPHLYVSLRKGRYQLSTANAIYSYADLYSNFKIAFHQINLEKVNIKKVLLLGFGLGSIPYILEKKLKKNYHYTAVEIDESVLYLASKYALPELKSPISLITADASSYVYACQEKFDLICMDVFLDDIIPKSLESKSFLQQLKLLLHPKGVLLFNKLSLTPEDQENCQVFLPIFRSYFPKGTYIDAKGNWVFLNRRDLLVS